MTSIPAEIPELQDGEKLYLGDDKEFSLRKDNSQLIFRDEPNSTDIPLLEIGNGNIVSTFDVSGGEPVYFGDNDDVTLSFDEQNDEFIITDTRDSYVMMSLPVGVSDQSDTEYDLGGLIDSYFVADKDHDKAMHDSMGIDAETLQGNSPSDLDYTDEDAVNATDGIIDADTVDGSHASDLGAESQNRIWIGHGNTNSNIEGVDFGNATSTTSSSGPHSAIGSSGMTGGNDGRIYCNEDANDRLFYYDISTDSWSSGVSHGAVSDEASGVCSNVF